MEGESARDWLVAVRREGIAHPLEQIGFGVGGASGSL